MVQTEGLLKKVKRFLKRWNMTPGYVPVWVIGMFVAFLWAAPFVWMVSTSFKPASQVMTKHVEWFPRTVVLANYIKVFEYPIARWALNSFIVATIATFLSVMVGSMAGYALARLNFPGRNLLFAIFVASLMIPTEMTIIPMLIGFIRIGWASTYQALILPTVAHVFSLYIFRQFFLGLPRELEDSAAIDGASRFTMFWRIAFPLARSPIIATTIVLFNLNWNNFLWPLLIIFEEDMKTMPVGIAAFAPVVGTHTQLEGYSVAMAAVTLLSLPSLLVFFLLQRYFIEGLSKTGIKG